MPEVLVVFESWKLSLMDVIFLLVLLAAVVAFILEYRKRKILNHRHEKILKHIDEKGKITNSDTVRLLSVSDDTALRDLTKLVEMKVLKRKGSGRGVYYVKV